MYRVTVVSTWNDETGGNQMAVALDYPANWTDVTEQTDVIPDPNLMTALGIISDAQYAALSLDADYLVLTAEAL